MGRRNSSDHLTRKPQLGHLARGARAERVDIGFVTGNPPRAAIDETVTAQRALVIFLSHPAKKTRKWSPVETRVQVWALGNARARLSKLPQLSNAWSSEYCALTSESAVSHSPRAAKAPGFSVSSELFGSPPDRSIAISTGRATGYVNFPCALTITRVAGVARTSVGTGAVGWLCIAALFRHRVLDGALSAEHTQELGWQAAFPRKMSTLSPTHARQDAQIANYISGKCRRSVRNYGQFRPRRGRPTGVRAPEGRSLAIERAEKSREAAYLALLRDSSFWVTFLHIRICDRPAARAGPLA